MVLPKAYIKKMKTLLEESYPAYEACLEDRGYGQTFRVNELKGEPAENLCRFLCKKGTVTPVPWCGQGFYYEGPGKLSKMPFYYGGAFYLQEPGAMAPASFLPVRPGDRVCDLCAAPGGKSAALAGKLQGRGFLLSNDISASRCVPLRMNLERAGVFNMLITCERPERLSERFPAFFDAVLVDAPCSGEGMFRKEPRMAASWSGEAVEKYSRLQREILKQAVRLVRPGGYLMYSTCTFSPEEDEQQAAFLLTQGFLSVPLPEYEGVASGVEERGETCPEVKNGRRFYPHKIRGEGQFAALFRKEENGRKEAFFPAPSRRFTGKPAPVSEEMRTFFSDVDAPRIFGPSPDPGRLCYQGEKVFYLPEGCPDFKGMHLIRSGLYLGEDKKKRFVPSQALASALHPSEYRRTCRLDPEDERVERYLKGESFPFEAEDGWILVCAGPYTLGWGKCVRGRLKNHLLPGWRKQ